MVLDVRTPASFPISSLPSSPASSSSRTDQKPIVGLPLDVMAASAPSNSASDSKRPPSRLDDCVSSIRRDVQQMEANSSEQRSEIDRLQQQLMEVGRHYRAHFSSWLTNYHHELQRQTHLRSRELTLVENLLSELAPERRILYLNEYDALRNATVPSYLLDKSILSSIKEFDPLNTNPNSGIPPITPVAMKPMSPPKVAPGEILPSLPMPQIPQTCTPDMPPSTSSVSRPASAATGSSQHAPLCEKRSLPTDSRDCVPVSASVKIPAGLQTPPAHDVPKSIRPTVRLEHGGVVCAIACSRSWTWIVTGGKGSIKLWKAPMLEPQGRQHSVREFVQEISCLEGRYVRSLLFTDDDRKLLIAGEHSHVEIYNVNTASSAADQVLTKEGFLDAKSASIYGMALLRDGHSLFIATSSGVIEMWDLNSNCCSRVFAGHSNTVSCVTATSDNRCLVSGSLDGTVRIWDIATGEQTSTLFASSEVFTISVVRGMDGSNWVLAGLANSLILTASLDDTGAKYCIQLHSACVLSVKFGPSGKWFVSASKDGTLNCSVIPTGQMICKANESSYVACCDISACGNYILSGGGTNAGMIYEVLF